MCTESLTCANAPILNGLLYTMQFHFYYCLCASLVKHQNITRYVALKEQEPPIDESKDLKKQEIYITEIYRKEHKIQT